MSDMGTEKRIRLLRPAPQDWSRIGSLIRCMPDAFSSEGCEMFLNDARNHNTLVAKSDETILGVIVWMSSAAELEILWLAVEFKMRRHGVGSRLIQAVARTVTTQCVIIAKTADPEQLPEGSHLSAKNFKSSLLFFESLGFMQAAVIADYWAPGNGAIVLVKRLRE